MEVRDFLLVLCLSDTLFSKFYILYSNVALMFVQERLYLK